MQQMNGFALDPENAKQIRVEFAKKNSKLRRDRKYYEDVAAGITPSQAPMGQPPQLVVPQQYNMRVPNLHRPLSATICDALPRYQGQAYASHGGPAYGGYDWSQAYAAPSFGAAAGPSGTRNPPSLTLHVANLSPDTTDQELRSVFSQCPGFKTLRVTSLRGSLVAFVEFIDLPSSSMGMQLWQGQLLRPTDRFLSQLPLAFVLLIIHVRMTRPAGRHFASNSPNPVPSSRATCMRDSKACSSFPPFAATLFRCISCRLPLCGGFQIYASAINC
jgi:hypothetical protein